MENLMGLLRIRVRKGINLAVRDTRSSDPFVLVTMGDQNLKTRVVKNNCNPEWNDELTLSLKNLDVPIHLTVYDKDTLTVNDKMGEAEIDIKPYMQWVKEQFEGLPNGTVISRVQPSRNNCLADESNIVWMNGKMVQDMCLRLKNVESGEVEIQVEFIKLPGSKPV